MACSSDREEVQTPGDVTTVFYKSADELAVTYDPNGNVNANLRSQVFDLYKQGNGVNWRHFSKLII
jgi:hypothetical protein